MATPSHRSSSSGRPFSLAIRGVTVNRADRPVLVDVDLTVSEQTRMAVVGPNGVGKSTLLRVLAGRLRPEQGLLSPAPPDLTVGLLDQEPAPTDAATVRAAVADRLGVAAAAAELEAASRSLGGTDSDPGTGTDSDAGTGSGSGDGSGGGSGDGGANRYDRALQHYLAIGAADFDVRLGEVAKRLGLADHLLDAAPSTLSGGEAERVGLATVMVSRFDLTLLDEPTNNLDLAGLDLLEEWVLDHSGGLVIVSHDRAFLERTVTSVLEIDGHHHTAAVFGGGWEAFQRERARAAALAEQRYLEYTTERDRLTARGQQQREWADQGASRVRKRPRDNDKNIKAFRLAKTERLAAKARATERAAERLEVVDKPWEPWQLRLTIEQAPRSAKVVAALDRAVFERGSFRLGPLDVEIHWADRVALIGPNGSGKSTLLDGLLGRLEPTEGTAMLGSGVVVGELGQRRDALDDPSQPDRTVLRAVQDLTGSTVTEVRSLLAKFGLDDEAVARPARSLSPGERTRAQLALFQAQAVNLLVLDEPTNHLDLEAIEQVEAAMAAYEGTLIVVSHDRRFLEGVSLTSTIDLGANP